MLRNTCLAIWIGSVLAAAAHAQGPVSVWDSLVRRAARLTAELPPLPGSLDACENRADLVEKLTATLVLPARGPMRAGVTYSREDGDLAIEEVTYHWSDSTYATATVIRPREAEGRRPAMVIPPGFLGHWTFRPYREFVESLARKGYVVLFIDDPRSGGRQAPYAGLYATASAVGTQAAGIQTFDALRGLDYLLTRADVDPGKIGIAGFREGVLQAYLGAALAPRFRFVIAVAGTTTYESLVRAAAAGEGPDDPSAFVAGILRFTDVDRVAACIAPRPVFVAGGWDGGDWAADGYAKVLGAMRAVYKLHDAEARLREVPGDPPDGMGPVAEAVAGWLEADVLPSLESSDAPPTECTPPEGVVGHHVEGRVASLAASLPLEPDSEAAWQEYRNESVQWLRRACDLDHAKPAADEIVAVSEGDELTTERIVLGVDADFRCPAFLVRPTNAGRPPAAAVVLSHDDRQSAASGRIAEAARRLAGAGCWVIVPDHASVHAQSLQPLADPESPSFYGDDAARFYGSADAVGLPPLALRVAEDLAAFRHLAGRKEVDAAKIVAVGLGLGGVDACLAAALEERIAGAASVDATTVRDWAATVAPGELRFFHLMPYLPGILQRTDLDLLYAAVVPRPLAVVRLKDGWPRSGYDQVVATTSRVYRLEHAGDALLALGPRDMTEELEAAMPEGIPKQLVAAARTLVPTPPQPGIVGTPDGLKSRQTTDSASGLVWVVDELGGYDQEFFGEGYTLETWAFFNDNGDAQKGRLITPLIFKQEGDKYVLTGVGTTRTNDGSGLQRFPFEPVAGTAAVGDGTFFGWHTGDRQGANNPGVAEFEDAPDSRMIILTADGGMEGQKLAPGGTYRIQSQYPRQYSIMAESKKP